MSSSAAVDTQAEAPDLVCELDSVRGIVDALCSVRWKRLQVCIPLLSLSLSLKITHINLRKINQLGCSRRIIRTRHSHNRRGNRLSSGQGLLTTRGMDSDFCSSYLFCIPANYMFNWGFLFHNLVVICQI